MGIDGNAFALGLDEQLFQVVKVVAGNHNEGSRFHGEGNFGGLWGAIGASIGLIQ